MSQRDRIDGGIRYLAREFSASVDEFRRDNQPHGEDVMTAMLTGGYARQQGDRIGLTDDGRARLADARRNPGAPQWT